MIHLIQTSKEINIDTLNIKTSHYSSCEKGEEKKIKK
jgi:hypothetical protein